MRHDDTHRMAGTAASGATTMERRVVPLKELKDYKVAEGDPDVRGWDVVSSDGRDIGEVDELLVDVEAMRVRYLDVELDRSVREAMAEGAKNDHILIPIGSAQIHEKDDKIVVDLLHSMVGSLPAHEHGALSRDYESNLRSRFDRDYRHDPARDRDFYEHDLYDPDRFYGPRRGRRL